jgi:hypothetical protein
MNKGGFCVDIEGVGERGGNYYDKVKIYIS